VKKKGSREKGMIHTRRGRERKKERKKENVTLERGYIVSQLIIWKVAALFLLFFVGLLPAKKKKMKVEKKLEKS
jgi:hypothetical protein